MRRGLWLRAVRAPLGGMALAVAVAGCGMPGGLGVPDGERGQAGGGVRTVLTEDQTQAILRRVLPLIGAIETGESRAAALVDQAFTGDGLRAAQARLTLRRRGVATVTSPAAMVDDSTILAVSRGSAYPRLLLARTSKPREPAVLRLLLTPNARTPYRVVHSAALVSGADPGTFPGVDEGAEVVTDGSGMAITPAALLSTYGRGLDGSGDAASFAGDPYAARVRRRSVAEARAVRALATFTQHHEVVAGGSYALRQADGGTLVFGVLDRTSSYGVRLGRQLTPSEQFQALVPGRRVVIHRGYTTTLAFLVFSVPRQGKARLVAASEQMVGAAGF